MKPKRLPEKLRQIREGLGLSQNGLIRQIGFEGVMVQASISGYESGTREPPLPVLLRYSEVARVWMNAFVDDDIDLPAIIPARQMHEGVKRPKLTKPQRRRNPI